MKLRFPQLLAAAFFCALAFTSAQAQQVPLPGANWIEPRDGQKTQ